MSAETLQHHRPENAKAKAAAIVNGALEEQQGSVSASEIRRTIEDRMEGIQDETRMHVDEYIDGVLPALDGEKVKKLEPGVGGVYYHDGKDIDISTTTVQINGSIRDTIARTKETVKHEQYHQTNDHGEPMKNTMADGDSVVTIGGVELTREGLIDGVTVTKTGDRFVSDEYRNFAAMVNRAISSAGITLGELEEAIGDKNLTTVDDRLYEHGNVEKEQLLKV